MIIKYKNELYIHRYCKNSSIQKQNVVTHADTYIYRILYLRERLRSTIKNTFVPILFARELLWFLPEFTISCKY